MAPRVAMNNINSSSTIPLAMFIGLVLSLWEFTRFMQWMQTD